MLQWTSGYICLFQLWFSQGICKVEGLLGHMILLFVVFFFFNKSPQWLYQSAFPLTVQEGSLFSTPSPAFICYRFFFFLWCPSWLVWGHCHFDLHFSNNEWYWTFFHVFVGHLLALSSLENCLLRSSAHFWLGCLFFWYWGVWAACIFWRLILCQLLYL